jgi:hypothetical protein
MNYEEFIDYCLSFYGPAGIYPNMFTRREIEIGLYGRLETATAALPYEADSVDRELVRDIVLKSREVAA